MVSNAILVPDLNVMPTLIPRLVSLPSVEFHNGLTSTWKSFADCLSPIQSALIVALPHPFHLPGHDDTSLAPDLRVLKSC
jgi:hypothetical protein